MITLQEAIELLPEIEEWENSASIVPLAGTDLIRIAKRERQGNSDVNDVCVVVRMCTRLYADAYRELIHAEWIDAYGHVIC